MKRGSLSLFITISLVILLSVNLSATGVGNVEIEISGGGPVIIPETHIFEIYVSNDAELQFITMGFEITYLSPVEFDPAYSGTVNWNYVRLENDAIGKFDLTNGLDIDVRIDGISPDTILIRAEATPGNGLPANSSRMCFTLAFMALCPPVVNGFCVDNIFVPPTGGWIFNDGSGYAPDFHSNPNESTVEPDAPAVCFDMINSPCGGPDWVTVPESNVFPTHCDGFSFDFDAEHQFSEEIYYTCSVGEIDANGLFTIAGPTSGHCVAEEVTVWAQSCCVYEPFTFMIGWIHWNPQISNCPLEEIRLPMDLPYSLQFVVEDDACDQHSYSVTHVGQAPIGTYQINTGGNFTFTADDADSGFTYTFEIEVIDGCEAPDQCQFDVYVDHICGDADQSGQVDISDVVWIISYIFFTPGPFPPPIILLDPDCSGAVDISDAVYLISFVFGGGPPPCDPDNDGNPDCHM